MAMLKLFSVIFQATLTLKNKEISTYILTLVLKELNKLKNYKVSVKTTIRTQSFGCKSIMVDPIIENWKQTTKIPGTRSLTMLKLFFVPFLAAVTLNNQQISKCIMTFVPKVLNKLKNYKVSVKKTMKNYTVSVKTTIGPRASIGKAPWQMPLPKIGNKRCRFEALTKIIFRHTKK